MKKKMEKYVVKIINTETYTESEISIFADEAETTENIILKSYIKGKEICVEDYNYFSAYQKLRDKLLNMNYGIKCKGSQLNAVQSGMMRADSKIYLVQMGKQSLNENIASLYEYSEIEEFPDSKAQNDFFEKWTASII